ncbi:MAG TPA: rhodanese-like domain-containing protein [Chloroflexota bacterium]
MPTGVHRNEVRTLLEQGAQLVDVLPPEEYQEAHIAGAVNVPLRQLGAEASTRLERDRPVITYCHDYQ